MSVLSERFYSIALQFEQRNVLANEAFRGAFAMIAMDLGVREPTENDVKFLLEFIHTLPEVFKRVVIEQLADLAEWQTLLKKYSRFTFNAEFKTLVLNGEAVVSFDTREFAVLHCIAQFNRALTFEEIAEYIKGQPGFIYPQTRRVDKKIQDMRLQYEVAKILIQIKDKTVSVPKLAEVFSVQMSFGMKTAAVESKIPLEFMYLLRENIVDQGHKQELVVLHTTIPVNSEKYLIFSYLSAAKRNGQEWVTQDELLKHLREQNVPIDEKKLRRLINSCRTSLNEKHAQALLEISDEKPPRYRINPKFVEKAEETFEATPEPDALKETGGAAPLTHTKEVETTRRIQFSHLTESKITFEGVVTQLLEKEFFVLRLLAAQVGSVPLSEVASWMVYYEKKVKGDTRAREPFDDAVATYLTQLAQKVAHLPLEILTEIAHSTSRRATIQTELQFNFPYILGSDHIIIFDRKIMVPDPQLWFIMTLTKKQQESADPSEWWVTTEEMVTAFSGQLWQVGSTEYPVSKLWVNTIRSLHFAEALIHKVGTLGSEKFRINPKFSPVTATIPPAIKS